MECFSVEGNRQWLDGGAMFGNAPKALWTRWASWDETNRIPLACRSLVVRAADLTVLFEAGVGFFMDPSLRSRYGVEGDRGLLLEGLARIGVREDDVDYVVLSHLHFDHAGGLIPDWPALERADWRLRFPSARYVLGRAQFERAAAPHVRDRASYVPELVAKLEESGRLILLDPGAPGPSDLQDAASFVFTHGHTPGLLHATLHGRAEKIFFCGDLVPAAPWLNPPIAMGYDRFPEQTVGEKSAILAQAAAENWLLFYTHDPTMAASRIRRNKGKYEPTGVMAALDGYEP